MVVAAKDFPTIHWRKLPVSLWIAEDKDAHEGMFLTMMSDRTEFLTYKLWQMSEARISSLA